MITYRRLGAKGSYLPLWRVSDRILYLRGDDIGPRYSSEAERGNWDIYDDFKLKKTFGFHGLYKLFQRCKGWGVILGGWGNHGNPNLNNITLLKWELKAPSH